MDRSSGRAAVVAAAAAVAMGLVCLQLIGPPPAVRQDDLWVYGHRVTVRVFFAAVACAASVVALLAGRRSVPLALIWLAGVVAAAVPFSDRLPIICDVVFRHSVG